MGMNGSSRAASRYVAVLLSRCSELLASAQSALGRARDGPRARIAAIAAALSASPVGALLHLLCTALAATGPGAPGVLVETLGTSPHALSKLLADAAIVARGIRMLAVAATEASAGVAPAASTAAISGTERAPKVRSACVQRYLPRVTCVRWCQLNVARFVFRGPRCVLRSSILGE